MDSQEELQINETNFAINFLDLILNELKSTQYELIFTDITEENFNSLSKKDHKKKISILKDKFEEQYINLKIIEDNEIYYFDMEDFIEVELDFFIDNILKDEEVEIFVDEDGDTDYEKIVQEYIGFNYHNLIIYLTHIFEEFTPNQIKNYKKQFLNEKMISYEDFEKEYEEEINLFQFLDQIENEIDDEDDGIFFDEDYDDYTDEENKGEFNPITWHYTKELTKEQIEQMVIEQERLSKERLKNAHELTQRFLSEIILDDSTGLTEKIVSIFNGTPNYNSIDIHKDGYIGYKAFHKSYLIDWLDEVFYNSEQTTITIREFTNFYHEKTYNGKTIQIPYKNIYSYVVQNKFKNLPQIISISPEELKKSYSIDAQTGKPIEPENDVTFIEKKFEV
jgi:hypothetical protein